VFGATARVERPDPGAATRITLTAEELTTVPGTFGEPLRVVATLPGVVRTPFGLGFFFVRGASFENTGFFVDGFPVPLLYHLGAGPAVLSSRLVRQLDFYPGGYPARFGRFSAGVIALETAAPEVESTHLELEVDLLKASALAIVPFDGDRATITLAYRRSYYELLLPLIVDGIELSYADWQARLDYEINEQLEASLFYFGSADALDLTQALGAGVGDEQTQSALSYGFHRLIGKLIFRLPHDIRLTWSGTVGIDQTEITRTDPGGTDLSAEITGTYLGQRLELVVPEGEHLQTVAGVDVLTTAYDAVSTLPAPRGLGLPPQPLPNAPTSAVGIRPIVASATPYIEQTLRLDPIEIAAAARLEYYQYASVDNVYFDPRGVVRYQMLDELVWKAATGLFTQPPQPFQIDPAVGNPELPPQRSWQTSAGLELDLPWKIDIESQVFYSRMMDLPRNVFQPDPDDPSRQQLFVADGEGQSYGWELLARREANEGFYGWLSYTLSWSERFLDGGNTVPFFFDQRHTLNLALSYAFDGWRFGARFQLSSGRPQRPVLGCEEDLDADRCSFIRGGLTERGPVYHQLDIRIDREFKLSRHFLLSIYLDVLNVYYAQNEEGRIYQWDSTRSAALPGIPTIGTIGVRMEYE
jgi:outer membrane receptor protein involved in Fe transport